MTGKQKTILAFMVCAVAAGLAAWPQWTFAAIGTFLSVFYLGVTLFRAGVLAQWNGAPSPFRLPAQSNDSSPGRGDSAELASGGEDPKGEDSGREDYCVLAALYREAGQVEALIAALDGLVWRHGEKRVYLICEEGDDETISAIKAASLPHGFLLVIVPEGEPRTKPRALNYCLLGCRGRYIVIYDAEDRPHPLQLEEARQGFVSGPPDRVCLQAPLVIDNPNAGWLARLFAIEYATLFSGILPALANWRAPMPLGGTSNHFLLNRLKEAGGWDPFNVTEDADLGIRLARLGFHCGVISSPTFEEAPAQLPAWLKQRTRWIKGWLQTVLVHSRHPFQSQRELGWRRWLMLQMVMTSVVVSVLIHPLFMLGAIHQLVHLAWGAPLSLPGQALLGISTFNLVAGYTVYGFLALAVWNEPGAGIARARVSSWWILLFPLYWLLISLAAWRAMIQLVSAPHYWEKTDHPGAARQTPLPISGRAESPAAPGSAEML